MEHTFCYYFPAGDFFFPISFYKYRTTNSRSIFNRVSHYLEQKMGYIWMAMSPRPTPRVRGTYTDSHSASAAILAPLYTRSTLGSAYFFMDWCTQTPPGPPSSFCRRRMTCSAEWSVARVQKSGWSGACPTLGRERIAGSTLVTQGTSPWCLSLPPCCPRTVKTFPYPFHQRFLGFVIYLSLNLRCTSDFSLLWR